MESKATALWHGNLRQGHGEVTTNSGVLTGAAYSFATRFEGSSGGTTPEELVAGAHAACFSMFLAGQVEAEGLTVAEIRTTARVVLEKEGAAWTVKESHLSTLARVPGASEEQFRKAAENAKIGCPISRLLKAHITLDARLSAAEHGRVVETRT